MGKPYKGVVPCANGVEWHCHVHANSTAEAFAQIVKQCHEEPEIQASAPCLDRFRLEDVVEVVNLNLGGTVALPNERDVARLIEDLKRSTPAAAPDFSLLAQTPLGLWLSRRSVWQLKAILFCLRLAMIGVLAGPVLLVAWMLYTAR